MKVTKHRGWKSFQRHVNITNDTVEREFRQSWGQSLQALRQHHSRRVVSQEFHRIYGGLSCAYENFMKRSKLNHWL